MMVVFTSFLLKDPRPVACKAVDMTWEGNFMGVLGKNGVVKARSPGFDRPSGRAYYIKEMKR